MRGHHVQRLGCDEVELFEPEVWQAAQFVIHSRPGMAAHLEVFSTMHRPFGLMHELLRVPRRTRCACFTGASGR